MPDVITRYVEYFNIAKAFNAKPPETRAKMIDNFFIAVIAGTEDQRVIRRLLVLQAKEEAKLVPVPQPSTG
jgi:hypothetical protein